MTNLERSAPEEGPGADCYRVACTALQLWMGGAESLKGGCLSYEAARHAVTLHRISGWLHRLAERACNEDLTCRKCDGSGDIPEADKGRRHCRACSGHGTTTGKRLAKLESEARAIAEHYGFRAYCQGDPRGCSLYVIPEDVIPSTRRAGYWAGVPGEPLEPYVYQHESANPPPLRILQDRWVASNYTRGHAVGRIGR